MVAVAASIRATRGGSVELGGSIELSHPATRMAALNSCLFRMDALR
jgi:hypothetical protein